MLLEFCLFFQLFCAMDRGSRSRLIHRKSNTKIIQLCCGVFSFFNSFLTDRFRVVSSSRNSFSWCTRQWNSRTARKLTSFSWMGWSIDADGSRLINTIFILTINKRIDRSTKLISDWEIDDAFDDHAKVIDCQKWLWLIYYFAKWSAVCRVLVELTLWPF